MPLYAFFNARKRILFKNTIFLTYPFYLKVLKQTMTASLSGFLASLFWGTIIVIIPITIALIVVSRLDPISRSEV